jgi:hypothetical protein
MRVRAETQPPQFANILIVISDNNLPTNDDKAYNNPANIPESFKLQQAYWRMLARIKSL